MRILSLSAVLAAAVTLSACSEEAACTQDEATKKATDLSAKITEVGTADPAKLAELAPKLQELSTMAAKGGTDLAAACKAMDEMMATLTK